MLGDGSLSFREFVTREPLPLATIQDAVLDFLRGRDDAVLFGAQAVNAHIDEPRMTEDVDLLSPRAEALAQEIRDHLAQRFTWAVRVREGTAKGSYRVFQVREPRNRHLVDLRTETRAPKAQLIEGLLVLRPDELVARKVVAYTQRHGQPKAGTDWRDIASLLLRFPDLKVAAGPVADRLDEIGASDAVKKSWAEIVLRPIESATDDW